MEEKKENNLTDQQFKDLLNHIEKLNSIEVSGVQVSSTTDSLKEIEEVINRLLERHKDFLLLRKELKLTTGFLE